MGPPAIRPLTTLRLLIAAAALGPSALGAGGPHLVRSLDPPEAGADLTISRDATPLGLEVHPLGATPIAGGGTVFRVWAPNASTVAVAGTFNGWSTGADPMTFDPGTGIWSCFVPAADPGEEYKFVLDGTNWRVDPRARDTVNSNGNGIVRADGADYPWQATDWQTPEPEAMIIYELHVGSFSGNGDGVTNSPATFRDVVDAHLDDLQALGINMVELMPIHEFPGGRSWGYNPVHFSAPESDHGAPDDLRYLIDTLHANGIGVILDVVYNHTSPSDNNLWEFDGPENIYFFGDNCMGETDWGNTRPRYTEPQVRDLILDNVRLWFEEYRVDGLRVDATRAMRGYCNEQGEGWLLMGDITDAARAVNPRAIVIAEDLPNDPLVTTPRGEGGAGYDAQWADAFGDVMREQIPAADPDLGAIAGVIANSGFGRSNTESVKYVESHDEAGNLNGGERINVRIDPSDPFGDRARGLSMVAGGLTLLSPGIPMLLQGQEFLEDKPFGDGEADRIWWGFLENGQRPTRDFFGALCRLRLGRPSLRASDNVQVFHTNDVSNVLAFQRWDNAGDVTVAVANLGSVDFGSYLVGVPSGGEWHELVNSAAPFFGGDAMPNGTLAAISEPRDGLPAHLDMRLPAHSLLVFSQTPLVEPPSAPQGLLLR